MIKITVGKNKEILQEVNKIATGKKITSASIILIGAVDSCCMSTMAADDAKKVILKEFNEPLEITGTGEIENGKGHVHVVLGGENKEAFSGHLQWGKVKTYFVNIYIHPIDD